MEPIVDSGPGSPSDCTLPSWETAAGRVGGLLRWQGGVSELGVYS